MDIAVVGVSCRFPSDIHSAIDLWDSLSRLYSCVSPLCERRGEVFKQAKGSAAMLKVPFDYVVL
ncbi:beta-ketoacyl synthase N-terminal-like domain-containing protein [uncultured Photobacterium sp.]|uniref:beta-ketoacyl synthase N-terminal-like domain-containing protein n=1 Tax=uncultured Photobacterium sp. TaxID=173973 RepID=UPI0026153D3F|nr:beta-ketoacyl synthase N-terminal-like domain-containing protein [uncultured Photobacterium sp.]